MEPFSGAPDYSVWKRGKRGLEKACRIKVLGTHKFRKRGAKTNYFKMNTAILKIDRHSAIVSVCCYDKTQSIGMFFKNLTHQRCGTGHRGFSLSSASNGRLPVFFLICGHSPGPLLFVKSSPMMNFVGFTTI